MPESGTPPWNPAGGGYGTVARPDGGEGARVGQGAPGNWLRGGRGAANGRAGTRIGLRAGAALLAGAAIGALTSVLQQRLDLPWFALVDASSPWLLGGFIAGALQSRLRLAVAAGLAACVLEVAAYYAANAARGYGELSTVMGFWTVCAVIGGPVFGWAGWAWLRGRGCARAVGAAFLPATFLAESVGSYWLELHYMSSFALFAVIGAALLAVVAWPARRLIVLTLGSTVLLSALGVVLYGPLLSLTTGGRLM
jgi:hypothetical protein